MPATITAKGQITIPKRVREALGIEPGSRVDFGRSAEGEVTIVKEGAKARNRFLKFVGIADTGLTTDEIMAMTRGED